MLRSFNHDCSSRAYLQKIPDRKVPGFFLSGTICECSATPEKSSGPHYYPPLAGAALYTAEGPWIKRGWETVLGAHVILLCTCGFYGRFCNTMDLRKTLIPEYGFSQWRVAHPRLAWALRPTLNCPRQRGTMCEPLFFSVGCLNEKGTCQRSIGTTVSSLTNPNATFKTQIVA